MGTPPQEAPSSNDEDWNIRKYIDFLRADEGDNVTLLCDNPDFNGRPNCAIECNGYWTNWEDRRYAADTIEAALERAYFECRQWRENPPPDASPDPIAPKPLPAYADPNFRYDEKTMSYHRIKDDGVSAANVQSRPCGDASTCVCEIAGRVTCVSSPAGNDGYREAWHELMGFCSQLKEDNFNLRATMDKLACHHVTENPLWWQAEARNALAAAAFPSTRSIMMNADQADRISAQQALSPCPFCGGSAYIYENEVDFVAKWSVGCHDCPANYDACEDEKADVVALWNGRADDAPPQETALSGDRASRSAIAQTFLDEDYQDKQLDSFDMADIMLRHWDVRWKSDSVSAAKAPRGWLIIWDGEYSFVRSEPVRIAGNTYIPLYDHFPAETKHEVEDLTQVNALLHGLICNRDAEIERLRAQVATLKSENENLCNVISEYGDYCASLPSTSSK